MIINMDTFDGLMTYIFLKLLRMCDYSMYSSLISYMSTMLTSEIIVSERLSGVWDRSAVAGVTVVEVLSTHFVLQFVVMVVQMFEVLLVVFVIYGAEMQGSVWLLSLFGILQGVYGICYGKTEILIIL